MPWDRINALADLGHEWEHARREMEVLRRAVCGRHASVEEMDEAMLRYVTAMWAESVIARRYAVACEEVAEIAWARLLNSWNQH